ncbi:hypothetical protein [uncultured Chryseobacterium sp.]|uniref:hypothetical protein n=1 Tax=uncultured Chryseobacterium sp. TaxID=259322 RepID=UPI0025E6952F|nr:hypothetical protein [uncultured Chryseobacterium sp.]
MYNPIRRNRNIGTDNQGFSNNNKLRIATPYGTLKSFYERIGKYHIINGHEFLFIVEETRENCFHSCSVNDIAKMIMHIPSEDYGNLRFIILRQAKRKEEIISPVWGRLIYSFEFDKEYAPAIILDAIDTNKKLVWSKKMTIEDQKEFTRLREDKHLFTDNRKAYISPICSEPSRNTQLYRTLLHEFGHYVHYLEVVERPGSETEDYEMKEERDNFYFQLPHVEKAKFAHQYADRLKKKLINDRIIPFDQS